MPTLPPITTVSINGHTYAQSDFEANPLGVLAQIANDIAALTGTLSAVGVLRKALADSNTTLSGGESQNVDFIFTGTLTATRTISFAAGSNGEKRIFNRTNHDLNIGIGASFVAILAAGSGAVFIDGTAVTAELPSGIIRSSATGEKTLGALLVNGALTTAGGGATIDGAITAGSSIHAGTDLSAGGNGAITGNLTAGGTFGATGAATFGATATFAGAVTLSSTLAVTGTATFSAAVTINAGLTVSLAGADLNVVFAADAGKSAWTRYKSGSSSRWLAGKNNTAEAGSDAGSDFDVVRLADDGVTTHVPFRIVRSNGHICLLEIPTTAPSESHALWSDSGTVKITA